MRGVIATVAQGNQRDMCAFVEKKMFLQQDNECMRTCAVSNAKIVELEMELLYYLAYSPDLTPSDPFLFPNLKKWLNGGWFTSIADTIAQTNEYFAKLIINKYFGKTCVQVG